METGCGEKRTVSRSLTSDPVLLRGLRKRLQKHNRQALLFTLLCAAGALLAWGTLYAVARWLTLLMAAIISGPYASAPVGFPLGFAAVALALIFSAWVDQRVTPNALPPDAKSPREIAMDFLLAVPRMTLAIHGNLSARQTLSHTELNAAAVLLERTARVRRIPVQGLTVEVPDDELREKALTALLLIGIVEFQREEQNVWLRISPGARMAFGWAPLE